MGKKNPGWIEGMDKRTTPEKSFKDVVLEGKNREKDIIGINYGGMEKRITENTITTGEKKRKEISTKENANKDGKEGKINENSNKETKNKIKGKKGKRRMVETKDGFETHEVGKKEESDEENKEKNWKNK